MTEKVPSLTYTGEIKIGGLVLPCCVFNDEDKTHAFSERAMFAILGIKGRGSRGGHRIASILGKPYIKPLISNDSWVDIETPIRHVENGKYNIFYRSSILGEIIKVLLQADKSGVLRSGAEKRYVVQAEVLRDALVNVWDIQKPMKSETGHSTQKPVECMKRPIENNSSTGQAVYEPFSGSGTTIIAGEITGRAIYAMEISPVYVDVAVSRWQEFTGKEATLDGDGRTFNEIREGRLAA